MKTYLNITSIFLILILGFSGCKKDYLNINDNPNTATSSTPQLVLPAVLNNISSNFMDYFNYGGRIAGYMANGGGFSFVGSTTVTYNFDSGSNNALFNNGFANLRSLQYIINTTNGVPQYALYNGVARILKSYSYQLVVDEYGDVPYTEAALGSENLTPHYDSQTAVYQALITEIDAAIVLLKANATSTTVTKLTVNGADVMFGGNVTKWIQFANNVKLRILTRAQTGPLAAFVNTAFGTFSSEGFLFDDVVIQPGYVSTSARQNPLWNSYHSSFTGTVAGNSYIPTTWMYSFYNGAKLNDNSRGLLMYRLYAAGTTPKGQLGAPNNPNSTLPNWYVGIGTGAGAGNPNTEAQGVLKSRVMGQLIFPASETYFLLAEAALNGRGLTGTALDNFENGIKASYNYLTKVGASTTSTSTPAILTSYLTTYKTANAASYLVNYSLTTTNPQRLEAIITQKYIALNFINGYEAWQEYKRTGYPTVSGTSATTTFASIESVGATADRLPVRNLYTTTEYNLNPNVPALSGISIWTSKIFWDNN
ncbi:SusD/RagB family nutrient-binding outer membrane lipoprotein [Pedobacter mucosus]|uniref:SusD/RagB family nutrient-binding outer membrane lipoprotein n=1 Tax=Pedobacter mucosus TaxID=2895286 RepID=UPI001EE4058C|nr:SusD/RagB family nutrient-binding outer membrane lipoprotein [Pedobacter mucosus]UKT65351.1 SusD/RagB family nutrient-binding outer membrane lipoprotein [Pedobacter mucosus]